MPRPRERLELLGIKEAAELIGWSRQKASVYYGRGLLPPPVARLACGPIWLREDMVRFSALHRSERPKVYRTNPAVPGWKEKPTLYWTDGDQYVFCDNWRRVISTHQIGYYDACLKKGLVNFSRRVVDIDGLIQSILKQGHDYAKEEITSLKQVDHGEAAALMRKWGWFNPE